MRYFTYMAEQSFKTAPSGERMYFSSGPWSRPYVLPDGETEGRIYRKLVWMFRIMIGGLILGQPFAFLFFPALVRNPIYFAAYLVGLTVAFWLTRRLLLAWDLRGLSRAPARLSMRSFYGEMAQKHSTRALVLGLVCCILFVALGGVLLAIGDSFLPAILCIAIFGPCGILWAYALTLKRVRAG